ncbi:MAG TPA: hypothetical protein DHV36_20870, partial [Desulfobacteraceae bacterium]|nr:hypothetical protein [Desulfobacteraceae bacterium]
MNDKRINCWEYMKCGRGPDQGKAACPAASKSWFDGMNDGINAGRSCWLIAGTDCKGKIKGTFARQYESCRQCAFFKQVHGRKDRTALAIKNIDIVGATHTGLVHQANEDRYIVRQMEDNALLLGVADGLGGDVSSDVAAELARGKLSSLGRLPKGRELTFLDTFIKALDEYIHDQAQTRPSLAYMATTLVCTVLRSDRIFWVNAGDSRFYLLRNGRLSQVSQDQTLANALVEAGRLKPEDAETHYSHKILDQCLGYGMCEPQTGTLKAEKGDLLLLSTDGL